MRVTQNSRFIPYKSSLEDIQLRLTKEQARLSSGKNIITLSDSPKDVVTVKKLTDLIERNSQYKLNINDALGEIQASSETLESSRDKLLSVRSYALDATQAGNTGNLSVISGAIKGILTDLIKDANSDYGGKFLYSGTQTTKSSIAVTVWFSTALRKLIFPVNSSAAKPKAFVKDIVVVNACSCSTPPRTASFVASLTCARSSAPILPLAAAVAAISIVFSTATPYLVNSFASNCISASILSVS